MKTRWLCLRLRLHLQVAALSLAMGAFSVFAAPLRADQADGVRVPEGFHAVLYADDDLASDIYSLTIDSLGRVVVSGAGYVRILLDTDGDGRADDFKQFADGPQTGAQGMCFDGRDLLCSGDAGLIRYRDADGDDRADGAPETLLRIKAGGEHHAHAIRKGPDGWWYLIAGNMAGVDESYVTSRGSLIKKPNAGTLLRLSPDFAQCEVYADGFRNAYDFDFDRTGDIFTFDSDGERDVTLPWYRPTRVFRVLRGGSAGWFTRSWKRPDYFPDMLPVVASLGRGSPTGVVCYRHTLFPEEYHGALFVLDWTFGRVLAIKAGRRGGDAAAPTEFMTGVGQFGFAPSDVEVGPDGALFVSVGGRGTRGGVYRIVPADARLGASPDKQPTPSSVRWEQSFDAARRIDPPPLEDVLKHLQQLAHSDPPDVMLQIRLAQLALGDLNAGGDHPPVFDGYTPQRDLAHHQSLVSTATERLEELYPCRDETANHEIARLIAMLAPQSPALLAKVLDRIDASSHPTDDIHHLIVAARIPARRTDPQRQALAQSLVALQGKITERRLNIDSNFEPRISELYERLVELDPQLPQALVDQPEFGRPGHVLFLSQLQGDLYKQAAEMMANRAQVDADFSFSGDIIAALDRTGDDSLRELIRRQFDNFAVRDAVLLALAKQPQSIDRDKFVLGLASTQVNVIEACAAALEKLPASQAAPENVALLAALRRLGADRSEFPARERVAWLLERNMQQDFGFVAGGRGYRPQPDAIEKWTSYLSQQFPNEVQKQLGAAGGPANNFAAIAAVVDWSAGDPQRGKAVYQQRSCAQCHGGRRALGPDLAGAANRFSRDDLFTAIVTPNRDVSPRYQTTLIETTGGKAYTGLIVYQSVDGVTLHNGAGETLRINADEIADRRQINSSLMPAGLLNDATPADIADLYAYLQTLSEN